MVLEILDTAKKKKNKEKASTSFAKNMFLYIDNSKESARKKKIPRTQ